ncbi:MAG: hypothetical protein NT170_04365 [Candidatus Moranbacteria bacterium]|nr:hypothetical protein [Candidatus Moranbacteria bacterium]
MNFQNNTANQESKSQVLLYLIPQHVSVTENPAIESSAQIVDRQEKFIRLEKKTRYKLASFETGIKIQAIGQKYQFELLRLANITRLIREYYFGEVRFEDFATEIEKRVGVSLLTAQEITRYIKSEIIDWDPWAQYVAKLPKMSVREMFEKKLKIADTEITSGYVELRGSDDLEDPTIKNWIHDYITHLGYGQHSQMQRTEYIFHSENGRDLSSPDREKLGIILRSFDENIPLPVDEENGEIVFDGLIEKNPPPAPPFSKGESRMGTVPFPKGGEPTKSFPLSQRGIKGDFEKVESKQESFIKPYSPVQQPPRQILRPTPTPIQAIPTQNFTRPNIADQPQPMAQTPPLAKIQYKATTSDPEINKYFNAPEVPDIPSIKIHSMTEHNEPKVAPQALPPRPTIQRPIQPPIESRPQHRIIEPFSERLGEPRIDGNIVDLSNIEE